MTGFNKLVWIRAWMCSCTARCFNVNPQVNAPEFGLTSAHPSPELVECLRQIAELSKHHEGMVQETSDLRALQQEINENVQRVEGDLQQKVDKKELNIPADLQDQLAMLKKGNAFMVFFSLSSSFPM